jgi:hypothetical protein
LCGEYVEVETVVGMKNIFVVELTLGIAFRLEMYLHKPTRPLQGVWKVGCLLRDGLLHVVRKNQWLFSLLVASGQTVNFETGANFEWGQRKFLHVMIRCPVKISDYFEVFASTLAFYILFKRLTFTSEIHSVSRSEITHTLFLSYAYNDAIDRVKCM